LKNLLLQTAVVLALFCIFVQAVRMPLFAHIVFGTLGILITLVVAFYAPPDVDVTSEIRADAKKSLSDPGLYLR
jgi:hypothetical protein